MKKLLLIFMLSLSIFAFDLTFTKAFKNFNKGMQLEKTNPKKASEYFQKAYFLIQQLKNKDTSQVHYMLGKMYCNGWGVNKDYKKAEEHFLRAIQLGNARAKCCIARLYIKEGKLTLAKKYLDYALSHSDIANYCSDIDPNTLKIKQ